MVNAALAFQTSNNSGTDLLVAAVAIAISIGVAAALLARQRSRVKPEDEDESPSQPAPGLLSGRQRKLMEQLEPVPEIPTLMDLVRQEIAEAGVDQIPGHEGLPEHVMLKVFKRDKEAVERCTHDGCRFVVADGVTPPEALDHDVKILCDQCGPTPSESPVEESGTNSGDVGTDSEESGTNSGD